MKELFDEQGFAPPIRIFGGDEAGAVLGRLRTPTRPPEWFKGNAAVSRDVFEVARHPRIVSVLQRLLGDDVLVWGASLVSRRAGQSHCWHTDIETSDPEARAVSVWVGLEGVNRGSSLRLAPYSHRFGRSLQQRCAEAGKRRAEITEDDVIHWAREIDARSGIVQTELSDGEALFFDGRLWHGSTNTNANGMRTALLLQYATPETVLRMPAPRCAEWPFRFRETSPPCVVVCGDAARTPNRIVPEPDTTPPPSGPPLPMLASRVASLHLPLGQDEASGWKPYPLFRGATAGLDLLNCHVSVLSPGVSPHPPHAHVQEELLILLAGEADLVTVDDDGNESRQRVGRGDFAYYPAFQAHTIANASAAPATYLMFKWTAPEVARDGTPLRKIVMSAGGNPAMDGRSLACTVLFEGPTRHLDKLHAHLTVLQPGGGYDPHADPYDVAIVTLEGTVESLGRPIGRDCVIFYAAGEPHGMRNVGDEPAKYLVFELHRRAPTG